MFCFYGIMLSLIGSFFNTMSFAQLLIFQVVSWMVSYKNTLIFLLGLSSAVLFSKAFCQISDVIKIFLLKKVVHPLFYYFFCCCALFVNVVKDYFDEKIKVIINVFNLKRLSYNFCNLLIDYTGKDGSENCVVTRWHCCCIEFIWCMKIPTRK